MTTSKNQTGLTRKVPVQSRANVTVDAICRAAIQLTYKGSATHLTTIRIAKRAGVSVGTYYQYFPNKEAVLITIVSRHLRRVTLELEKTCRQHFGQSQEAMISAFVQTYVAAQLADVEEAVAVYRVGLNVDAGAILARERAAVVAALAAMLSSCPSGVASDVDMMAQMFFGAVSGAARAFLINTADPKSLATYEAYLEGVGHAHLPLGTEDVASAPTLGLKPAQ